jgi:hypothetical protein
MVKDDKGDASSVPEAEQSQVREILDPRARNSTYLPQAPPKLALKRYRRPINVDELTEQEQGQLEHIWQPLRVLDVLSEPENQLEVAEVVDLDSGQVVYRLWAWNYGVGYLVEADSNELVARGRQRDIDIERLSQRPVFFAMDRALQAEPAFQQPLSFGWWDDEKWDNLADEG